MTIEIGSKPLKEMTAEDVRQIVMIEGCCAALQFWNEPIVLDFDNTTFGNTRVIDYHSFRTEDNKQGAIFTFFLDFESFRWHYTKDKSTQTYGSGDFSIDVFRYLIRAGYDVPIYTEPEYLAKRPV